MSISIQHIKFEVLIFTVSKYMTGLPKFKKMGHLTLTTPLLRVVCHPYRLGLAMINRCTEFKAFSSSRYEDCRSDTKVENLVGLGS